MRKTTGICAGIFVVLILMAAALGQSQWEKATSEKLTKYLPEPVQGLVPQFSWDPKDFNTPGLVEGIAGWSGEEVPYDPDYQPVGVFQRWRISDPALVDQVNKAEKAAEGERAREKKIKELQEKMKKAAEAGNSAELQKLQEEYGKVFLEAGPGAYENKNIKESERLKGSARELRVVIQANFMPKGAEIWSEGKGKGKISKTPAQPSATVKGYPVGRNEIHYMDKLPIFTLAVYLGPAGLKVKSDAGPYLRQEVKAIFLMAEVHTDAEHRAADEALALQMLEKVDFEGLLKLLTP